MAAKTVVVTAHCTPGASGVLLGQLSQQVADTSTLIQYTTEILVSRFDSGGGAAIRCICNDDPAVEPTTSYWTLWTVINSAYGPKNGYLISFSNGAQQDLADIAVLVPDNTTETGIPGDPSLAALDIFIAVNWSSAITFSNGQLAIGSDGNVYQSTQDANSNHNPTTDNGTWWNLYFGTYLVDI